MYKGRPLNRKAMADALRGTKNTKNEDRTKTAIAPRAAPGRLMIHGGESALIDVS
jgi:hypothetical protein